MLFDKNINDISEADLQALMTNQFRENRQHEYKRDLPRNLPEDKTEFLKDVVAFANSAGGILLYGVDEERDERGTPTGIPKAVEGVSISNVDAEILRLENVIRDGIDPRILGYLIKDISLSNGNKVLAVRVPKSWNAPHAVNYNKHWRFYARVSASSPALDVSQVRELFSLSENLSQQIKNFRADRVAQVLADETPVPMEDGAKLILHIMPIEAFGLPGSRVDFIKDANSIEALRTIDSNLYLNNKLPNFDGNLMYRIGIPTGSYMQVFRSGIIEFVDAHSFTTRNPDRSDGIFGIDLARTLNNVLKKAVSVLSALGIYPPITVSFSLVHIKGYKLIDNWVGPRPSINRNPTPIDREVLLFPDQLIDDLETSTEEVLHPIFEVLWNASGFVTCDLYDENGEWRLAP